MCGSCWRIPPLTSSSSSVIPLFPTLLQPQETEARARRVWLAAFARAAFPCRPPSLPSQRFPSAEDLALTNWVFGESGDREGLTEGRPSVEKKRRCVAKEEVLRLMKRRDKAAAAPRIRRLAFPARTSPQDRKMNKSRSRKKAARFLRSHKVFWNDELKCLKVEAGVSDSNTQWTKT